MTPTTAPSHRSERPAAGSAILCRRSVESPIGPLQLVAGPAGLRAVLWPGEDGSRVARALAGAPGPAGAAGPGTTEPPASPRGPGGGLADEAGANAILDRAAEQLAEYFAGSRREFDLALDPVGTPFQQRAWEVLRGIPYGATMSYGEQAAALGDAGAARAVGAANGRNPISIIVPCHRVVAASGNLTGFAGGISTKAWLLAHERATLTP